MVNRDFLFLGVLALKLLAFPVEIDGQPVATSIFASFPQFGYPFLGGARCSGNMLVYFSLAASPPLRENSCQASAFIEAMLGVRFAELLCNELPRFLKVLLLDLFLAGATGRRSPL